MSTLHKHFAYQRAVHNNSAIDVDGLRILMMLIGMYRQIAPLKFYGAISAFFALASVRLGTPIIYTYASTGLVPSFPTAVLAAAIAQISVLMLVCGLIAEAIAETRREVKRFNYLEHDAPRSS